jgi:hypothetical protein
MKRRIFLRGGPAAAWLACAGSAVAKPVFAPRGNLTFWQDFRDPSAPLLRADGGRFSPYYTYFGGPPQPDGPPGYRWWNDELQVYSTPHYSPDPYNPFKVANGVLSISAQRSVAERTRSPQPYVSGCIETSNGAFWDPADVRATRGGHEQKYGYWEIRCRIPQGKGIWAAFWLAGGITGLGEQKQGELDVFETIGEPGRIHQTAHDWWAKPHKKESRAHRAGFDYSAAFHTYGLLWTSEQITWYVDGVETHRASASLVARYRDLCGPMYLQANIAVGGSWPGAPNRSTVFPATMQIEFIRVYTA